MVGHGWKQCFGRCDAVRNGLVDREHVESVVVWPMAGNRAWPGIATLAQIRSDETYPLSTRLQTTGRDTVNGRFDNCDGVEQRAGQRDVDVIDDEHQLSGL